MKIHRLPRGANRRIPLINEANGASQDSGDFEMTVFEGLLGQNIKTTRDGHHHLPARELSLAEMISSGAYRMVTGIERLTRR
jgi:hypothetical protein